MKNIIIDGIEIGEDCPTYIVAEVSANHNGSVERAKELISLAKGSGANAVKLQTYTPDTITLDVKNEMFSVDGTIWEGRNLYDLYKEAYTPWEWHKDLFDHAKKIGISCFSSPFDSSAVDFLEELDPPAYKVASPELVDIPLIRKIASTGKPIIMSTGMGEYSEIEEAVAAVLDTGNKNLVLLKCTSAYPAPLEEANLRTIPDMKLKFNVNVGLSDHTIDNIVSISSVAMGACFIEKHFTLSRDEGGPDAAFSLEPNELKKLVNEVRKVELSLGKISYSPTQKETISRKFRRSLFVAKDVKAGDLLSKENVRSVRPSYGLHTRYHDQLIGKTFTKDINKGEPLKWEHVQ